MPTPTEIEITVTEVAERLRSGGDVLLLDVREEWEFEAGHVAVARHLPVAQIPMHLAELVEEFAARPGAEIICYCHSGRRSLTAADWLRRAAAAGDEPAPALASARSMAGGIDAWSSEIDASIPRY